MDPVKFRTLHNRILWIRSRFHCLIFLITLSELSAIVHLPNGCMYSPLLLNLNRKRFRRITKEKRSKSVRHEEYNRFLITIRLLCTTVSPIMSRQPWISGSYRHIMIMNKTIENGVSLNCYCRFDITVALNDKKQCEKNKIKNCVKSKRIFTSGTQIILK